MYSCCVQFDKTIYSLDIETFSYYSNANRFTICFLTGLFWKLPFLLKCIYIDNLLASKYWQMVYCDKNLMEVMHMFDINVVF